MHYKNNFIKYKNIYLKINIYQADLPSFIILLLPSNLQCIRTLFLQYCYQ